VGLQPPLSGGCGVAGDREVVVRDGAGVATASGREPGEAAAGAWIRAAEVSPQGGVGAAERGRPYAFADCVSPAGAAICREYRRKCEHPRVMVAVSAICAETEEEAWRISASSRMAFMMLRQGQLIAVPPIDTALAYFREQGLRHDALPAGRRAIIGSPSTVRAGIQAVADEYGAEEVMIVTITHGREARKRSYELTAHETGTAGLEHSR